MTCVPISTSSWFLQQLYSNVHKKRPWRIGLNDPPEWRINNGHVTEKKIYDEWFCIKKTNSLRLRHGGIPSLFRTCVIKRVFLLNHVFLLTWIIKFLSLQNNRIEYCYHLKSTFFSFKNLIERYHVLYT